jgi:hypothetical protein
MKIAVETKVAAPIETVWEAYTTPEDIKQWNAASNDWHTTSASVDLREGGTFLSRMEAKDGSAGFDFGHRSLAFDVACEVVEDRLPPATLLLLCRCRVGRFYDPRMQSELSQPARVPLGTGFSGSARTGTTLSA